MLFKFETEDFNQKLSGSSDFQSYWSIIMPAYTRPQMVFSIYLVHSFLDVHCGNVMWETFIKKICMQFDLPYSPQTISHSLKFYMRDKILIFTYIDA
jgi:hypothetical protein